jgi:capsular exopolysaccharide synthesis family protein
MNQNFNINIYFAPLKKWWWLLAIAASVAGISSFLIARSQPPLYVSRTTLVVGNVYNTANPNSGEFYFQQQLAGIYADYVGREPIRRATMETLKLPSLPASITAQAVPNTPLIEIIVTDTNPTRAMVVVNELANQLIEQGPATKGTNPEVSEFVSSQMETVKKQINETQTNLTALQDQVAKLTSARQIADAQSQIQALQTKLISLQNTYAALLSNTQRGATNAITVIEKGAVPTEPVSSNLPVTVLLSALVGAILASAGAYGIEFLDDTVSSIDDVKQMLGGPSNSDLPTSKTPFQNSPILGYIGVIPKESQSLNFFLDDPRSPIADSFRMLRTNLTFAGFDKDLKVILVSSSDAEDGKSTIASNLAMCLAQSGKKVILVDADLRKPSLHNALDIPNANGLSDICLGRIRVEDALVPWKDWRINVVLAGTVPPNPVELLESERMTNIIDHLKSLSDYTIIDCPPLFFADSWVLSTKSDGLLFVISLGHTKKKRLHKFFDQVQKTGINLVGVVVNRVKNSDMSQSGYYYSRRSEPRNKKESTNFNGFIEAFKQRLRLPRANHASEKAQSEKEPRENN